MADVFDNRAPDTERARLWKTVQQTPDLQWLLLTKRPKNIERFLPDGKALSNMWLGTTVENRRHGLPRLETLRKIEAPDVLGFRNDCSILIECKASRSDFLADKKKRFRKEANLGVGDWRFYLCLPSVINVDDLPEGWGLLYSNGNRIMKIHGVPPNTQWYSKRPFSGSKDDELRLMYSALRRIKKRGHFDCIYE